MFQDLQVAPTAINKFDEQAQQVTASRFFPTIVVVLDTERFYLRRSNLVRHKFDNQQLRLLLLLGCAAQREFHVGDVRVYREHELRPRELWGPQIDAQVLGDLTRVGVSGRHPPASRSRGEKAATSLRHEREIKRAGKRRLMMNSSRANCVDYDK